MPDKKRILMVFIASGPLTQNHHRDVLHSGGVRASTLNIAEALRLSGHSVSIMAAEGSDAGYVDFMISGKVSKLEVLGDYCAIHPDGLIAHMWQKAFEMQGEFDIIINMSNDWLPLYLFPFFSTPVLTRLNFSSDNLVIQDIIQKRSRRYPKRIAALSHAHARHYVDDDRLFVLNNACSISDYCFHAEASEHSLVCLTRISPEKDLVESARIAHSAGLKLVVYGVISDERYFQHLMKDYGEIIEYRGFLEPKEIQQTLGKHLALLLTPSGCEAFGNVVIEALACGLPVIVSDNGGHSEIIAANEHIGFVYPKGDIAAATHAVRRIEDIDRAKCRAHAFTYDLTALKDNLERWFGVISQTRG